MGSEKTICYLCEKQAEKWYESRNLHVRCSECSTYYALSADVQYFRIDKDTRQLLYMNPISGEKIPLTDEQKQNLIKWVREKQDPEGKEPAMITMKILDLLKK